MIKTILPLLVLLLVQCGTYQNDQVRQSQIDNYEITPDNFEGSTDQVLAHMLRKESGVVVSESAGRYVVKITGMSNSLKYPSPPLYVVNGLTMGHDFNVVVQSIYGSKIKSVQVLKDAGIAFYGIRGSGGVISIKTKN